MANNGKKGSTNKVYPIGSTYLCNIDYATTVRDM